jgi:hypothetical protein
MSGEHAMEVSVAYTLAVTHHPRALTDNPDRDPRNPAKVEIAEFKSQRFLLNRSVDDELTRLLGALGGAIDVVGMPAIEALTVEIQPQRADESSVPVRILTGRSRARAEVWIPLEMMDYSRRKHPDNRDPLPSLAKNPVVPRAGGGGVFASGDGLLYFGCVFTIISCASAKAIGLFNRAGAPARPADFTLPAGGISGEIHQLPGFRIDRIELSGDAGAKVIFEKPFVVVHDVYVSTTLDDGRSVTLDGILGMNLLLNSGSGFNGMSFATAHESQLESIIVDGKRARLGLTPRSE